MGSRSVRWKIDFQGICKCGYEINVGLLLNCSLAYSCWCQSDREPCLLCITNKRQLKLVFAV